MSGSEGLSFPVKRSMWVTRDPGAPGVPTVTCSALEAKLGAKAGQAPPGWAGHGWLITRRFFTPTNELMRPQAEHVFS